LLPFQKNLLFLQFLIMSYRHFHSLISPCLWLFNNLGRSLGIINIDPILCALINEISRWIPYFIDTLNGYNYRNRFNCFFYIDDNFTDN
jgi:hypothetical protein